VFPSAESNSRSNSKASTCDTNDNPQQKEALELISDLKGLPDRLTDASIALRLDPAEGGLEHFLRRSEAIALEFLSAVRQRRQRRERSQLRPKLGHGRKRRRATDRNDDGRAARQVDTASFRGGPAGSADRSLRYYEAFRTQLCQLDVLLGNYQHDTDTNTNEDEGQRAGVTHNASDNRITINQELTKVTITYHDQKDRCHELVAQLPRNFPIASPVWTCDLPLEFEPKWTSKNYRAIIPSSRGDGKEGAKGGDGNGDSDGDADGSGNGTNLDMIQQSTTIATSNKDNNGDVTSTTHNKLPIYNTTSTSKTNTDNTSTTTTLNTSVYGGLPAAFQHFSHIISTHQPLWNQLDDLDSSAWVLEPSLPARRSCTERRVALRSAGDGGALGLYIVLDPLRPQGVPPSVRLVGASADVGELREAYRRYTGEGGGEGGKDRWSADISVRDNLGRCFGFPLPSPATSERGEYVVECGICYVHRLPLEDDPAVDAADDDGEGGTGVGVVPSVECKNPSCARSYHESCLFEWLHSLPTARVSFDRLFGTCPYCCESLSVKARA